MEISVIFEPLPTTLMDEVQPLLLILPSPPLPTSSHHWSVARST
jgi:hypothetical protein